MQTRDIVHLAESLLSVVLAVGRVQVSQFQRDLAVETKVDRSPVTAVDRQSEEIILDALATLAPGVPVVAEESATTGEIPCVDDHFFLVDPLDGTKGFIKGRREFTINIGLIDQRQPIFGILYAPALGDLYVTLDAGRAGAASVEPAAGVRCLADCNFVPLRSRQPNLHALTALTSQSHLNRRTTAFLDQYRVVERRAVASSLKFGLIAKGEADFYPRIGETSEWDTAAGHAVLLAAGGSVTTLSGEPLTYGKAARGFVNPDFVAWGRGPLAPTR